MSHVVCYQVNSEVVCRTQCVSRVISEVVCRMWCVIRLILK